MIITKALPKDGTKRTRKSFALLPVYFDTGTLNAPERTMVWLDYYLIKEYYGYGQWNYSGKELK